MSAVKHTPGPVIDERGRRLLADVARYLEEQMPLFGGASTEFDGEGEPKALLHRIHALLTPPLYYTVGGDAESTEVVGARELLLFGGSVRCGRFVLRPSSDETGFRDGGRWVLLERRGIGTTRPSDYEVEHVDGFSTFREALTALRAAGRL